MNIIDSHLHLVNLDEGDYAWLRKENPPFWPGKERLCRSFSENDLCIGRPLKLVGFVHVEAGFNNRQPWREIEWLEKHCTLPFRSIAFADLSDASNDFESTLDKIMQYRSVVGVRNILEANASRVLSEVRTCQYLSRVSQQGMVFEIGMNVNDKSAIAALCAVMEQLPALVVIIDHAGLYADHAHWLENMTTLARYARCYIKCSGWEMEYGHPLDRHLATIKHRITRLLTLFGEDRVMLGSNFPVCLLAQNYQQCWGNALSLLEEKVLTQAQWHKLSFANACKVFGFDELFILQD